MAKKNNKKNNNNNKKLRVTRTILKRAFYLFLF